MKRAINDFWYRLRTLQFQSIWFLWRIKQQQKSSPKKISTRNNANKFEPLTFWDMSYCVTNDSTHFYRIESNRFKFSDDTYTHLVQWYQCMSITLHFNVMNTMSISVLAYHNVLHRHTDSRRQQQQKSISLFCLLVFCTLSLQHCRSYHINKVNIPANRIDLQIIWYIYIIIENWDLKDSPRIEFDWIYEWKFS